MVNRMVRACLLDKHVFEEVEADTSATTQALAVVALIAFATGIASFSSIGISGLFIGVVFSVTGWALWAFIIYLVGTKILPGKTTHANWGEVARALGFAQSPGIFRLLGIVPIVGTSIVFVASIWMLVAMVIAVRQALDYDSTIRAIGVVLLGFIPYMVLLIIGLTIIGS